MFFKIGVSVTSGSAKHLPPFNCMTICDIVCIGDTNIHTDDSRTLSGIYVFSQKTGQLQKSSAVIELPKIPTYHPKIDYILCIKELNGG